MKIFLRVLAMILLVVPGQQIIRGLIAGFIGNGYDFSVFGLSNPTVIIGCVILILISLLLFYISECKTKVIQKSNKKTLD